jgi:predicted SAM-dependent methyltransferase
MNSLQQVIPQDFRDRYRSQWYGINLEVKTIFGKLTRPFIRPRFPQLEDGSVYIHVGCGSINHPKFINIDGLPAPHIHYIRAIDDLSPFKDNSADLIYACHCLEHFPHTKVLSVLAEWFRVLKPGGILRLSVPDFDLLLNIYKENGSEVNTILNMLMGGQDYKYNFHMVIFNRKSIERLLRNTGFKEVLEWHPGSCELTTFDDYSNKKFLIGSKYYPVSLNIEAVK